MGKHPTIKGNISLQLMANPKLETDPRIQPVYFLKARANLTFREKDPCLIAVTPPIAATAHLAHRPAYKLPKDASLLVIVPYKQEHNE